MKKDMKAIDKLLFNTLVKHQGVNLPDVGALDVVYEQAQLVGDNIYPPRWRVSYSREEKEGLPSLVKLVENYGKMSAGEAESCYRKWLNEISIADNRLFAGVGSIKEGKFTQSNEMTAALAPEGLKSRRVKSRKPNMTVWFGLVFLVVLITFGVYLYNAGWLSEGLALKSAAHDRQTKTEQTTVQPVTEEAAEAEAEVNGENAAENGEVVAENVEAAPTEPVAQSAQTTQPAQTTQTDRSALPTVQQTSAGDKVGRYVLSVGVFREEINADKTIEKDPLGIGKENYKRTTWRGRTMVYVMSSDNRSEVNRAYLNYVKITPDIALFDMQQQ